MFRGLSISVNAILINAGDMQYKKICYISSVKDLQEPVLINALII